MDANSTINWLLAGEPWVRYRTRLDTLEQQESDPEVKNDYSETVRLPEIQALIAELLEWPGAILNSHKSLKPLLSGTIYCMLQRFCLISNGLKRTPDFWIWSRSFSLNVTMNVIMKTDILLNLFGCPGKSGNSGIKKNHQNGLPCW